MSRGNVNIVRSGSPGARGGGGGSGIAGLLLVGAAVAVILNIAKSEPERAEEEPGSTKIEGAETPDSNTNVVGFEPSPKLKNRVQETQQKFAEKRGGGMNLEKRFRDSHLTSAIEFYEKRLIGKEWKSFGRIKAISHKNMGNDTVRFQVTLENGKGKELTLKPVLNVKFKYYPSNRLEGGIFLPGRAKCGPMLFGNGGCSSFPGNELPGVPKNGTVGAMDKKFPHRRNARVSVPPKRNIAQLRPMMQRVC